MRNRQVANLMDATDSLARVFFHEDALLGYPISIHLVLTICDGLED
jgi:hypothetical protein